MSMKELTLRQQKVLNRVVETHIETAQPVGSRTITERYRIESSPATVRHEMGILGEMGYLDQPHTSSGRIPTDQGYRHYVDHGLEESFDWEESFSEIEERLYDLSEEIWEPESFVEEASRVLAARTQEVGLIFLADSSLASA